MPLPSWPAGVPYKPRRSDWSMPEPYVPPVQTDMEGGNTRSRSKPGSNVATIEQTLRFTPAEHDSFQQWLRTDLNNGTSRFTAQVWLGSSYQTKTCQFVSPHPAPAGNESLKIPVRMRLKVYGI